MNITLTLWFLLGLSRIVLIEAYDEDDEKFCLQKTQLTIFFDLEDGKNRNFDAMLDYHVVVIKNILPCLNVGENFSHFSLKKIFPRVFFRRNKKIV